MNKYRLTIVISVLGTVFFFALLGWAGRVDYNEQVLLHMSQEDYDSIVQRLSFHGNCPSDDDIVKYYDAHYR